MNRIISASVCIGATSLACASSHARDAEVSESAAPIVGGQVTTSNTEAWIELHDPTNPNSSERCTGTFLSDRVVVIAAHCTFFADNRGNFEGSVGIGQYQTNPNPIWAAYVDPRYVDDGNFNFDLAFLVTAAPVAGAVPAPLGAVAPFDVLSIFGYGTVDADNSVLPRNLKTAIMLVTAVQGGMGVFAAQGINGAGCGGDSGGGAFDAAGRLVGVQSHGARPCGPNVQNVFTSVGAFATLFEAALSCGNQADAAGPRQVFFDCVDRGAGLMSSARRRT
jgi:hypothetical protein